MLRQSLHSVLARQADLDVEAVEPDPVELLAAVDRIEADVVIVTLPESGEDPGISTHLLAEFPGLLVIAVSAVGERAVVYRQVITREELRPVVEGQIVAAIRSQAEKLRTAGELEGGRWKGFPKTEQ